MNISHQHPILIKPLYHIHRLIISYHNISHHINTSQHLYPLAKLPFILFCLIAYNLKDMSQTVKKIGNYKLLKKIGSGATSEVFEGRKEGELEKYAIKMIKIRSMSKQQKEMIAKEVLIIKSISHPNIVSLHETLQTSNNYYLIFEYCEKGDLEKYLKQNIEILLKPDYVKKIITCIAEAIHHLHAKGIAHRDIKLANILLKKDFTIKLADFGFAREFNNEQFMMQTYCGTPITMAPQVLLNKPYDKKCDIWSIGVILFQLIFGKLPFPIDKGYTVFIQKVTEEKVLIPEKPKIDHQLKELIFGCLQINKNHRYSIEQFLESEWINSKKAQMSVQMEREQNISDLLKRVSKDKMKVEIMQNEMSEGIEQGVKEENESFEKALSKRIYAILHTELMKIIKKHLQLRKQILKLIDDNKDLQNLLVYYDWQIINNLHNKKIKLRSEGYKDIEIQLSQLPNIYLPQPYAQPSSETYHAALVLLSYLKKLAANQNTELEKKKTRYQIILLFLDLIQNFDLQMTILFSHGYEFQFAMAQVVSCLYVCKEQEQDVECSLNHITIVLESRQKQQKFRECANLLKASCQKRMDAIQKQINGY